MSMTDEIKARLEALKAAAATPPAAPPPPPSVPAAKVADDARLVLEKTVDLVASLHRATANLNTRTAALESVIASLRAELPSACASQCMDQLLVLRGDLAVVVKQDAAAFTALAETITDNTASTRIACVLLVVVVGVAGIALFIFR